MIPDHPLREITNHLVNVLGNNWHTRRGSDRRIASGDSRLNRLRGPIQTVEFATVAYAQLLELGRIHLTPNTAVKGDLKSSRR